MPTDLCSIYPWDKIQFLWKQWIKISFYNCNAKAVVNRLACWIIIIKERRAPSWKVKKKMTVLCYPPIIWFPKGGKNGITAFKSHIFKKILPHLFLSFKEDYVLNEDRYSKLIRIHPVLPTQDYHENRLTLLPVIQSLYSN